MRISKSDCQCLHNLHNKIVYVLLRSQHSNMYFCVHERSQIRSHKNAFCTLVYTTDYPENSCVHWISIWGSLMCTKIKPWELLCTQTSFQWKRPLVNSNAKFVQSEFSCVHKSEFSCVHKHLGVYSRDEQWCPQSTKIPVESPYYYICRKHAIFVSLYVKQINRTVGPQRHCVV